MKEDPKSPEATSRRQFTKAIVTAAVAAPIAASMACKTEGPDQPKADEKCPVTVVEKDGYVEATWNFPIHAEDHIPPMGIDGGGSLIVDSKNKLMKKSGSGSGPFTYGEDGSEVEDVDRYGEIRGATIIIEIPDKPFLKIKKYTGFRLGTELRLWNQSLRDQTGPNENEYEDPPPNGYPANDPDVTIKGGKTNSPLSITIKKKVFDEAKSHKTNRPHRYKHTQGGGIAKHFRIGQWRFVNGGTTLAEGKGDDNYLIYLEFDDFQ